MLKKLSILSSLIILTGCIEASNNGRNGKNPTRTPQDEDPCNDSNTTIQCATEFKGLVYSQIHRSNGAKPLTYSEIQELIIKGELPTVYRQIPEPSLDNDNNLRTASIGADHDFGKNDCGKSNELNGVIARLNDCKLQHEEARDGRSVWRGSTDGLSGEGQWNMIYRDNDEDITLWLDTRTNLVWSHSFTSESWKVASGYLHKDLDEGLEPACKSLNSLTATENNPDGQIAWRLPNRNEFLQADINGARYIFDNTEDTYWTASTASHTDAAWRIKQSTGQLEEDLKVNANSVRCVGVILK